MSEQAEHPATAKLAVILNAIRNGKVTGSPREMAASVISLVFEGEMEKWDASDEIVEGGYLLESGLIQQTTKHNTATHHRTVLVFYSDWEEGAPPQSLDDKARANFAEGMDLPESVVSRNYNDVLDALAKQRDAFKRASTAASKIAAPITYSSSADIIQDRLRRELAAKVGNMQSGKLGL